MFSTTNARSNNYDFLFAFLDEVYSYRIEFALIEENPGPHCSKLATLLVNVSLFKISNVNIWNLPILFVENMWEAFAVQKLLSFFQQKISVHLVTKS